MAMKLLNFCFLKHKSGSIAVGLLFMRRKSKNKLIYRFRNGLKMG